MDKTDLISIIIPTYNRAHIIKQSIESVLNQTYNNIELIIVDDGSIDNTKEVVDSIKDERIIYVKQENQGACSARNKGVDFAKGQYIAFHDSDDVWHLDKLEKQIKALKQNNADIVFCKMFVFGNFKKRIVPKNFKEGFLQNHSLPLGISTQTLIGKSEIFFNNKFDTNVPRLQDFELLLRIHKNYSVYCIDEPLVDYCVQKDSISEKPEKLLKAWEIILEKNKSFKTEYSSSLEYLALIIVNAAFNTKDSQIKSKLFNFAYYFSKSNKIKLECVLHKFYFYKTREMLVKAITIPTKNTINFFRKFI